MTFHLVTELQPQVEWFWFNAFKAVTGEPHERQMAIRTLLDMANNHEDDRLRTRAASLIVARHWGKVEALATGPEGSAA